MATKSMLKTIQIDDDDRASALAYALEKAKKICYS